MKNSNVEASVVIEIDVRDTEGAFFEVEAKLDVWPGYAGTYSRSAETDAEYYGEGGEINQVLSMDYDAFDENFNPVEFSPAERRVVDSFIHRWICDHTSKVLDEAEPVDDELYF